MIALPALVPLFGLVAALVRLDSSGPVIFSQNRIGRNGRPFRCLKFRTMFHGRGDDVHRNHFQNLVKSGQPMKKLDSGDDRITRVGKYLRSSGLDEIPQIINVLRGQMSLIGPRPCADYEYWLYSQAQMERFEVLPGITGLWQVSGKNRMTFADMVDLDIQYARTASFWMDVRIVLATPFTVVAQLFRGSSQEITQVDFCTTGTRESSSIG